MSIQDDKHTQSQSSLAKWGQYPPSNSGYQWTCNLCNSIFGTLEQREKHQHECPGINLPSHQSQWNSSVSSRQPSPLYGGADILHKYYPPITQPQMPLIQETIRLPPPQLPVTLNQHTTTPAMYQQTAIAPGYLHNTTPAMFQQRAIAPEYLHNTTPAISQYTVSVPEYLHTTTPAMHQNTVTTPEYQNTYTSATYNYSAATVPEYQNTITSAMYQHKSKEHAYQHTPAAIESHTGSRRVELYWMKESPTLDIQVTYIDEVYGGIVLQWNSKSEIFEGVAELSLGQHTGCLTLSTNDTILPIKQFIVEQGSPDPQKIMITTGQRRVVTPQTDRGRVTSEEKRSLQDDINRLTADLDNRNNELVQQRQEYLKYKQENTDLTKQVELLLKDNKILRTAGKPVVSIPVEIETLQLKIQEWEKKYGILENEVIKFKEEKNSANEYSDYLYQQKQQFEDKLQEVQQKLNTSQIQITELKANLQEFVKDENAPPPLPTRCKPVLKEETQSADKEVKESEN
ncbi:hypothetical protein LOD99_10652 [Oopsacas minuta]|uniref:C2H2-type domain-containing protein n=1 Tax=Oopsacas minuta TaxID=111878 RepID=A0AAV7KEJ3_9METZ|nr:hypothetical protein LOD99_10652 [Oopsacas minuta]